MLITSRQEFLCKTVNVNWDVAEFQVASFMK